MQTSQPMQVKTVLTVFIIKFNDFVTYDAMIDHNTTTNDFSSLRDHTLHVIDKA